MMEGIHFIPVMIGVFAVAEVLRNLIHGPRADESRVRVQKVDYLAVRGAIWKFRSKLGLGSAIGTVVGALPGAGSDIAAWISLQTRSGTR